MRLIITTFIIKKETKENNWQQLHKHARRLNDPYASTATKLVFLQHGN
jgi:hypothetical protein